MTATGDLRAQLADARNQLTRALAAVDDAFRLADALDDDAILAAERFLRSVQGGRDAS